MKRRLLILTAFLLAGAVVNVAVAWGIALRGLPVSIGVDVLPSKRAALFKPLAENGWQRYATGAPAGTVSGFGCSGTFIVESVVRDGHNSVAVVSEYGFGWPLRSLRLQLILEEKGEFVLRVDGSDGPSIRPANTRFRVAGGIWLRGSLPPPDVRRWRNSGVPLLPIWPGFAVNTLLYATVLWLLICGPFALRRLIRIRRGLCPACAYPRGESAVCSECGNALPKRAKVAT